EAHRALDVRVRVAVSEVPARTPADLEATEQPDPVEQLARRSGEAHPDALAHVVRRRVGAQPRSLAAGVHPDRRASVNGTGGAVDEYDVVAAGPQAGL